MCGIVAVLQARATRPVPTGPELTARLDAAIAALGGATDPSTMAAKVSEASAEVEAVDAALHGVPGVQALLRTNGLAGEVEHRLGAISARSADLERSLDEGSVD